MAILRAVAARWFGSAALVAGVFVTAPGGSLTAQQSCDPAVVPAPGDDGYRLHSDGPSRCEGVYRRSVSGRAVYFMAWAWSPIGYDVDALTDITVSWAAPDTLPASLRVDALPGQNLAYRLDVDVPAGTTKFTWPATLLRRHQVVSRRFQAQVVADLGGVSPYLPVRVSAPSACTESAPQLVVYTGRSIRNIVLTAHRADDLEGAPVAVDTLAGSRPPGRFVAPVTGLTEPGVYRFVLEAQVRTTRSPIRPETYYLYYPGAWEDQCTSP